MAKAICVLTDDQKKDLLGEVVASLSDLMKANQPFDIKAFVKDIHDFVEESAGPDYAIAYAALVPTNLRLSLVDEEISDYLGDNFKEIKDLEKQFKDVENVLNFLELQPEEETSQQTTDLNEEIAERNAYDEYLKTKRSLPKLRVFSARPNTLESTTGDSQVDGRAFSYNFLDFLINDLLEDFDGSTSTISETTGLYLTAARAKGVLREGDDPSGTLGSGIIQIVSDDKGNPIYFDKDYNITTPENGRPVFFRFRENIDTVQTVAEISKTLGISEDDAAYGLDKQLIDLRRKKEYLFAKDGRHIVQTITSASLGFIDFNYSNRNQLSKVTDQDLTKYPIEYVTTTAVKEGEEVDVQEYMFIRGLHKSPVSFRMNTVDSDMEFVRDAVEIILGNVSDEKGNSDTDNQRLIKDRKKFLRVFFGQNKTISIVNGQAMVDDKVATAEDITRALTQRVVKKGVIPHTLNYFHDHAKGVPFYTKSADGKLVLQSVGLSAKEYRNFVKNHAYTFMNVNDAGQLKEENGYLAFETTEEEREKYTNPVELQEEIEEAVTGEEKEQVTAKTGVEEVFKANPELSDIGTQEQYSEYLDTVFPGSKVKDIVYHGSDAEFDGFLEDSLNYFGTKEIAKGYGKNLYAAVIGINKPYYEDGGNLSNQSYEDLNDKLNQSNSDGFISNGKNLFVPKTENQILLLGSKEDLKGFKDFVSKPTQAPVTSVSNKRASIQMQPANIEKIKAGTKTTTTRSESQAKQINIPVGQSAIVNFGGQDFKVTNRGLLTIEEAGGKEAIIKSEGVKSESEFMYQQTKNWVNGKGKLYVYDIAALDQTAKAPVSEKKPGKIEAPKGFSIDDYLERFKLTGQKTDLRELTPQQIERITKWFESSPLSKHITLNTLFNVVNSKAVGRFVLTPTQAAIYLYKGSDYTDLYHEAWHAFTSMFITEEKFQEIYGIAKKLDGTFTNSQGNTVKFSEATPEEIDEYLAEDFRKFMVEKDNNVGKTTRNSKIQSFFQAILDILKALFNVDVEDVVNPITPTEQLHRIYQDLRVGDIAPVPVRYAKNTKVFNKIKTLPQNSDMFDEDLGYTNSMRIVKSIDGILSSVTDALDKRKLSTKRYSSTIMSNPESRVYAYNMVLVALINRRNELEEVLANTPAEKQVVSETVKTGKKIISKKDIDNFNKVNAYRKNKEFFTPDTLFSEFYNNETGKKGGAPQSSSWILNDRGYYDLIDKASGEVYIENVDLTNGVQMIVEKQTKNIASQEYADIYNAFKSIDYSIRNFAPGSTEGEPITLETLQQAIESGKGTIAFHLQKSKYISLEEKYEALNSNEDDKGRSDFRDRSGNEISAKELASRELMYVFRGLFKYEGKTPVVNEFGFPEIIDFDIAWSKVLRTISGLKSPMAMYTALEKKGKTDPMIAQFLSKVGSPNPIAEGTNITLKQLNLWTDIFTIFSMPRIPLRHLTVKLTEERDGTITDVNISSGRAESDTRAVRNDWDAQFQSSTNMNPYVVKRTDSSGEIGEITFKGNFLNVRKVVDDFKTKHKTDPVGFLRAIGMMVSDAEEISIALSTANKGKLRLFSSIMYKKLVDIASKNSELPVDGRIYINKPSSLVEYKLEGKNDTGAYEELLGLETRFSDKYGTAVVYNAARDLQWEYSLPSTLSKRIGYLNSANSYGNLIQDPRMKDLDTKRNPFTRNLMVLTAMFGKDYDVYSDDTKPSERGPRESVIQKGGRVKRASISLENSAGISTTINDEYTNLGVKSFNTDESSSILENFFKRIKSGVSEATRHSDKTTTYLEKIIFADGRRDYIDVESFAAYNSMSADVTEAILNTPGVDIALQQFKYYLQSEVARMHRLRNGDPSGEFATGKKKYKDQGSNFYIFQDILSPKTKEKIINKHLGENLLESIASDTKLMDAIDDDILNYLSIQVSNFKDDLLNTGIENNPQLMEALRADIYNNQEITDAVAQSEAHFNEALYWGFVVNDWIHKHEMTVLFYGDPALFEDLHKRNAGGGGTGTIPRTDAEMLSVLNTAFPRMYADSKWFKDSGMTKADRADTPWDITYDTAVLQDTKLNSPYYDFYVELALKAEKQRKGVSELTKEEETIIRNKFKEYNGMKIGDGQGWVSFDSYRNLMIRMGRWSDYQNEMFLRIMKGEDISMDVISRFFPVLKMQYWGQLDLEEGLPATGFHKYSLMPLIPNVIAGTKLETLHNRMASQGIDYAMFQSASKIATVTTNGEVDKFYQDNGKIGPVEFAKDDYKFTVNRIFLDYFKNQQETNDSFKGYVSFSTQLRSIIENGSMEQGFPIDYEKNLSNTERRTKWESLTNNQKVAASPIYAKINNYRKAVDNLSEYNKMELLKEAGVTVDDEGNYTISDKLIQFIQKQLSAREILGEHEIEFMNDISDFSIHPNAAQIEKLIMAIVHKRLVRQHVNGEPLIQVSSAGFEPKDFEGAGLRKATDEENKMYGSTDLDFYTPGNAMKVKIAMQGPYKVLLEHKDVIKLSKEKGITPLQALNRLIRDEKWLSRDGNRKMVSLVGVRIPVQGLNSVEWAEVYEFLPENAGNMIIVPAEIVAKSGSDFDIDKLFMMFPQLVKVGKNIRLAEYNPDAKANLAANKELLADLYSHLDSLFEKVNDMTTAPNAEGTVVKVQDAIYQGILKYKAEKEAIKEKIYGENPEDNPEVLEELHEQLHKLKRHLSSLYNMSKDLSAEVQKVFENEINPTFEEIENVRFDMMSASSKGLENDLMMSIIDIVSIPENFVEFVTPNGTYYARPIAESISEYVTDYDPYATITNENGESFKEGNEKVVAGTRLYELRFNRAKQSSNNIGKVSLGMAAVHNKYHPIKNGVGAYLNPEATIYGYSYPDNPDDKYTIVQTLRMPHNIIETEDGDAISLSHNYDVNDMFKISDTNSQMINGFVDVAKNDWIFWIQGNKEVTPILQFLVDAGVDLTQAAYFVSQPIIRDYVDRQRRIKGTFARALKVNGANSNNFRNIARVDILNNINMPGSPYPGLVGELSVSDITKTLHTVLSPTILGEDYNTEMFSKEELFKRLEETSKDRKEGVRTPYTDFDYKVFVHFLEAEEMAKADTKVKMSTNFDTQKMTTLFELISKVNNFMATLGDVKLAPNLVQKIMERSPIGTFKSDDIVLSIFGSLFELRTHPAFINMLNTLESKMSDYKLGKEFPGAFKSKEDFIEALRNDFIVYAFQEWLYDSARLKNRSMYKGMSIKPMNVNIQRLAKLDQGAYVSDGVLYVDPERLEKDVISGDYASRKVYIKERKLATIPKSVFENSDPEITKSTYNKFVYERETLRYMHPFSEYTKTEDYKQRVRRLSEFSKDLEKLGMKVEEMAYELFLRDTALMNTLNIDFMFRNPEGYASQIEKIYSNFPQLASKFPILNSFNTPTNRDTKNIALAEATPDTDTINAYNEQLERLADPNVKKVDNELDNMIISNVFAKFSLFALNQAGLNAKGQYNITRLSTSGFKVIMEEVKAKAIRTLNNKQNSTDYLKRYWNLFSSQYKSFSSDMETEEQVPYRIKRIKDYNNNLLEEGKKTKPLIVKALYNPTINLFRNDVKAKTFMTVLSKDKGDVNLYIGEASNSAPDKNNGAVLGDTWNNSILQDMVANDQISSGKVFLVPTKNVSLAVSEDDFVTDDTYEENIQKIEAVLQQMLVEQNKGKNLVFSSKGYGMALLGYGGNENVSDPKNKIFKASKKYKDGIPARKTFVYLSQRLLDLFGYVNPMYDTMKEEYTANVIEKQEFTDADVARTRRECFKSLYNND